MNVTIPKPTIFFEEFPVPVTGVVRRQRNSTDIYGFTFVSERHDHVTTVAPTTDDNLVRCPFDPVISVFNARQQV